MKKLLLILTLATCNLFAGVYYAAEDGSDGNDGLTLGAAKTLQGALDVALGGDTVKVVMPADGNFTITQPCTLDMNAGANASPTATAPLTIWGCDVSGNLYSDTSTTAPMITAASNINRLLYWGIQADHITIRSLKFNGSSLVDYCIQTPDVDGIVSPVLINCVFRGSASHGLYFRTQGILSIDRCYFTDIGGYGAYNTNIARTGYAIVDCVFRKCVGGGIRYGMVTEVVNSTFTRCGNAIYPTSATGVFLHKNTFFKCGRAYNGIAGSYFITNKNNIYVYCTDYAIFTNNNDSKVYEKNPSGNNVYFGNTANIDINGGVPFGSNNITLSPGWSSSDTSDATENLSLPESSPCRNAGVKKWSY